MAALVGAGLLLVIVVILVKKSAREKIAGWFASEPNYYYTDRIWLLLLFVLAYHSVLTLLAGKWELSSVLVLAFYFLIPILTLWIIWPRRAEGPPIWLDLFLITWLWLPVELIIVLKSWNMSGVSYPFTAYCALIFVLIAFTGWRKIDWSLDWLLKLKDLVWVLAVFAALAVILTPLGRALKFSAWPVMVNPKLAEELPVYPWTAPLILVFLWFTPALVEEMIFRGVIQNYLSNKLKPILGIVAASIIFGAAHINNETKVVIGGVKYVYDFPNWRYVILATIAGFGYGFVYYQQKRRGSTNVLGAAALLHALVDFTWLLFYKVGQ